MKWGAGIRKLRTGGQDSKRRATLELSVLLSSLSAQSKGELFLVQTSRWIILPSFKVMKAGERGSLGLKIIFNEFNRLSYNLHIKCSAPK